MTEKPEKETEKTEKKKSATNSSIFKKSWRGIPLVVIVLVLLGIVVVAILFVNSSNDAEVSDQDTEQQLYTHEEQEAVEASQLSENVDKSVVLQSEGDNDAAYAIWRDEIENASSPNESADAMYSLGLAQWNGGDINDALVTMISVEDLGSDIDLFRLYSATSAIALEAGDKSAAIKYTQLTIDQLNPDAFEYDWEYVSYAEAYDDQLKVAESL